jgi:hypothetical protein
MMGILPQGHDFASPSSQPLWRDFSVDRPEVVTWALIGRGAGAVVDRLLEDVGLDRYRWELLIDRIADTAPNRDKVFAALESAEPKITDKAARSALWRAIRQQLHRHRFVPDAEWAIRCRSPTHRKRAGKRSIAKSTRPAGTPRSRCSGNAAPAEFSISRAW